MPYIPWAVGERETFEAAKESARRQMALAGNIGGSVGTIARLYKAEKQKDEDEQVQDEAQRRYDEIERQTAEELQRQDEQERKSLAAEPSAPITADTAVRGTDLEPDPHTVKGVQSPGTAQQDVQTSKQPPGRKPSDTTQQGATSEAQPPPATKEESANDQAGVVRGQAEREPDPNRLNRLATASVESSESENQGFGTYVTKGTDAVVGAAKSVARGIANLGGGRFWRRMGNIIGMEDPLHNERLHRLARAAGEARVRQEEQKRGSSLQAIGAGADKPGVWLRNTMPYTFRHTPDIEKLAPRPRGAGAGNPNTLRLFLEAEGDDSPEGRRRALSKYYKAEAWLARMKASGRAGANTPWYNVAMDMIANGDAEEQIAGRQMLEIGRYYGLSRAPAEDLFGDIQRFRRGMRGEGEEEEAPPPLPRPGAGRRFRRGGIPDRGAIGEPPVGDEGKSRGARPDSKQPSGSASAAEPPEGTTRGGSYETKNIPLYEDATVEETIRDAEAQKAISPKRAAQIRASLQGRLNTKLADLSENDANLLTGMLAYGVQHRNEPEEQETPATTTSTTVSPTTSTRPPTTTTTLPKKQGRPATPEEQEYYNAWTDKGPPDGLTLEQWKARRRNVPKRRVQQTPTTLPPPTTTLPPQRPTWGR